MTKTQPKWLEYKEGICIYSNRSGELSALYFCPENETTLTDALHWLISIQNKDAQNIKIDQTKRNDKLYLNEVLKDFFCQYDRGHFEVVKNTKYQMPWIAFNKE